MEIGFDCGSQGQSVDFWVRLHPQNPVKIIGTMASERHNSVRTNGILIFWKFDEVQSTSQYWLSMPDLNWSLAEK
jgi:predicted oxidoreductase